MCMFTLHSYRSIFPTRFSLTNTKGTKAKDFMDRGVLVPDEVVVEMVKSRLASEDVQVRGMKNDA